MLGGRTHSSTPVLHVGRCVKFRDSEVLGQNDFTLVISW